MIKINNITFSYKNEKTNVFKDFSLNIKEGERVWLSAPSGKGKTTLLRIITGLEKVKKGSVTVKDNAKISAVFQEDRLIPFISVKKNISLFSSDEKAEEMLSLLGLEEWGDSFPDALSGGMKRRAAIARALSKDFDILILDEAFNGLDEETLLKTCNAVNRFTKDKTLILISHRSQEALLLGATKTEL